MSLGYSPPPPYEKPPNPQTPLYALVVAVVVFFILYQLAVYPLR